MTTALDQDIEKLLNTPGIGLQSQWNEIEHKWKDVLVSLVSNLSLIKRDDPEVHVNRTIIYQHADATLTHIDGLLTTLHTVCINHAKYLEPMGLTEAASEKKVNHKGGEARATPAHFHSTDDDWPSDVTPPHSPRKLLGIEKGWKASEQTLAYDPKSTHNPYLVSAHNGRH